MPVRTCSTISRAGDTIDEFLRGFPTVTRKHVVAFLERTLKVPNAETRAAMMEVDELMRQRRARFATTEEATDYACSLEDCRWLW